MNELIVKLYTALRTEEEGATAVEYGMMVALIAAVIVTVVATLGGQVQAAFQTISDALLHICCKAPLGAENGSFCQPRHEVQFGVLCCRPNLPA
ncbi:MAG: Flp family type IVb pilin, partial [Actinomycetota bacterium]|nr:Flp family type IVb pilin [Actinomycetota bacterium]